MVPFALSQAVALDQPMFVPLGHAFLVQALHCFVPDKLQFAPNVHPALPIDFVPQLLMSNTQPSSHVATLHPVPAAFLM